MSFGPTQQSCEDYHKFWLICWKQQCQNNGWSSGEKNITLNKPKFKRCLVPNFERHPKPIKPSNPGHCFPFTSPQSYCSCECPVVSSCHKLGTLCLRTKNLNFISNCHVVWATTQKHHKNDQEKGCHLCFISKLTMELGFAKSASWL